MRQRTPEDLKRLDQKLDRWVKAHPVLAWGVVVGIVLLVLVLAESIRLVVERLSQ